MKQVLLLSCVTHIVLQQQAVHFAVNIFYGYLKAVEGPSLRKLDICSQHR